MNDQAGTNCEPPKKDVEGTRDNQENELEAEQESAAAMDADVPQPGDEVTSTEPE